VTQQRELSCKELIVVRLIAFPIVASILTEAHLKLRMLAHRVVAHTQEHRVADTQMLRVAHQVAHTQMLWVARIVAHRVVHTQAHQQVAHLSAIPSQAKFLIPIFGSLMDGI
jgi:hypothetical protein